MHTGFEALCVWLVLFTVVNVSIYVTEQFVEAGRSPQQLELQQTDCSVGHPTVGVVLMVVGCCVLAVRFLLFGYKLVTYLTGV